MSQCICAGNCSCQVNCVVTLLAHAHHQLVLVQSVDLSHSTLLQACNMSSIAQSKLMVKFLTKQANTFYLMFLGETGSGKSTLLNMFVNFFRGKPHARGALPQGQDIKAAVPTAHIAVTEPEGAAHSERNAADRRSHYAAS